nr:MAG TPA: hypothetical protein [Caudoviricetes sp.]
MRRNLRGLSNAQGVPYRLVKIKRIFQPSLTIYL